MTREQITLPGQFDLRRFDHPKIDATLVWLDDRVEIVGDPPADQKSTLQNNLAAYDHNAPTRG